MAWLRITGGAQNGHTFRLEGEARTIGRGVTNHIQLEDVKASRRHATIQWAGSGHQVIDHGSENSVYVGEERVFGREMLSHGDVLTIGRTKLVYESAPNVNYPKDFTRQPESEEPGAGETKGVSLAEVQQMMAELSGGVPPAAPAPAPAPAGGSIPLAGDPVPPRRPAAQPARPAVAPDGSPQFRAQVLAALQRRIQAGVDVVALCDLVVTGVSRGLLPDRGAVLLKSGAQGALKPVKTWQRPDIPAGTPAPPMLREMVMGTMQRQKPGLFATGTPMPMANAAPRPSPFAALCAPILTRNGLVGVVYADNGFRRGHDFRPEDLRFAMDLAAAMAPVL